jgi:DNA-binding MarR family transcriptional regulator
MKPEPPPPTAQSGAIQTHPVYCVPDPEPYLQLDRQLCFALYSSARMIVDAYGPILDTLGVTYPQYMALMVVWEADGITEPLLARRLRLQGHEADALLAELAETGLLERTEVDGKREVWCTQEGWAVRHASRVVPNAIRCRLLMPEDQIGELKESLEAMMRNLELTAPLVGDATAQSEPAG